MNAELTPHEQELLSKVPEKGETIGNISLIRALKWPDDKYWDIRNKLLNKGIIKTERGQGGSIRRIIKDTPKTTPENTPSATASQPAEKTAPPPYSESILYDPAQKVIREKWIKDYRIDDFVLEVTANQGPRKTGGIWSRPDIVVVSISTYPFMPAKYVDITTFEIKPYTALDVTSVYEALAHLRAATRAFVLLHVPEDKQKELQSRIEDIYEEANRHGVGLIVAQNIEDYETWDFQVEAVRNPADPMKLNDFIASQMSPESKEKLQKWCR